MLVLSPTHISVMSSVALVLVKTGGGLPQPTGGQRAWSSSGTPSQRKA